MESGASSAARGRPRGQARKHLTIGIGLLATLLGLLLIGGLLPFAPGSLARLLPIAAGGALGLWIGGILMGIGSRQ